MKLQIILIGEESKSLRELKQQLEKDGTYAVDPRIRRYEDALGHLWNRGAPVVAIVNLSAETSEGFSVAEEIKTKCGSVRIVMTSSSANPEIILRAMRSGAEEFLPQPFDWLEVTKALELIRGKVGLQHSRTSGQGQIIAVSSNKGGVGSTTVAANLSAALVAQKKSVCLVDLVLQFGSVTSFLNLEASYTILDLVKNLKRIDPLFLDGSLVKHASGVRVLAEPFYAEDARRITPADIEEILDVLLQSFDYVVVDTPKEFDELLALVLEKANLILFVTEMDVPSLKSAHRAFELFSRMGILETKILLVLNRYIKSKLMTLESAEKALGSKVFWTLPNNYPTAIAAVNQGLSIQECDAKSDIAKSYAGLADAVLDHFATPAGVRRTSDILKPGLLNRWNPVRGLLSK